MGTQNRSAMHSVLFEFGSVGIPNWHIIWVLSVSRQTTRILLDTVLFAVHAGVWNTGRISSWTLPVIWSILPEALGVLCHFSGRKSSRCWYVELTVSCFDCLIIVLMLCSLILITTCLCCFVHSVTTVHNVRFECHIMVCILT